MQYYGFYDENNDLIAVVQKPHNKQDAEYTDVKRRLEGVGLISREISADEYAEFDGML